MARIKQVCLLGVLLSGFATAQAPSARYLLRIEHSSFEGHACALLQTTGTFHLEVSHGEDVKVSEGIIPSNAILEIESNLNAPSLVNLLQEQVEEPLIRTRHDELQVTVLRNDGWQDLYFRSSDSQQPFARRLQPLVHWLDNLHKLPHRELSEDEGKNNCLPPRPITLKKRDAAAPPEAVASKTNTHILSAGPTPQPAQPMKPHSVSTLLRVYSFEMKSGSAHESCALIGENGLYRFEARTQMTGKPVSTKLVAGQITSDELRQLSQLLDDPALAAIKHRDPPGGMVVRVMGDMLDITVSRPAGTQHFILSSRFNRPGFASFYRGDADAGVARPLLKFLSEHLENNPAGILDPSKRNGCSQAP